MRTLIDLYSPETIDLSSLPSIPLTETKKLPACRALYFVLDGAQTVYYIGQTSNLFGRWRNHHLMHYFREIATPCIAWLSLSETEGIKELEIKCIDYFSPLFNRKIVAHDDLVIIRVREDTRHHMKVLAAIKGESMIDFLEEHFAFLYHLVMRAREASQHAQRENETTKEP